MAFAGFNKFFKDTIPWLLFTNHCLYCNKLIGKNDSLCDDCKENLPVIGDERCKYCGADKLRCSCKKHRKGFEAIIAPFYYEDGIKTAIHNLKFNGKEFVADILAEDMAKVVKTEYENIEFDFICYVPFSFAQRIKRPYNQSELLALNLSQSLNVPVENVMVKHFDTKGQHNTPYKERAGNVFGIYDIAENADVKGKTILLVDDVKTSGATLDECAWILRIRGAEKVFCVVSAIAGIKSKEEKKE